MKTALSMAALVVLLATGCESSSVAEQAKVTTSAKPTTRLYVHTIPKGAEVSLGDGRQGTSPQLFDVPAGVKSMIVEVELGDHEKQQRRVVIEGGRIIRVEFRFTKKAQPPAESVAVPQTPRILLYLVVGKDRMTFQGKDTIWDELAKLLEKVPASKNTVLHIARAPGEMTAEHWDQAVGRAIKLIKRFGFGNLSQIGVHPLGFSGPTKRHSVCLVVGKDRMTFQGKDTTWEELPKLLEKIADRQRTVLNFARAPGKLTTQQWHRARSRAVGLAERFGFDHLSDIGEHPLGSKWEETRTLPEAKGKTPAQPSAGIPAKSIWDRVMNPPRGWKVEKSFIVPEHQTAAIGKKVGGRIKKLSNTIYSAHGEQVQVNVFECPTNADAEKIHKAVLARKGDPAYALRFDKTIVEFVGTFDVAFAKRAARELGLQPKPDGPKGVSFGPEIAPWVLDLDEAQRRQALDLDNGQQFDLPDQFGRWSAEQRRQWFQQHGVELLTESTGNQWALVAADPAFVLRIVPSLRWADVQPAELRRAVSSQIPADGGVETLQRGGMRFHILGHGTKPPVGFAFKTCQGRVGFLQIVGFTNKPKGVKIRYKLVRLPAEQTVRQVIYKFAKACVESDKDTVANLLHEKSRHMLEQLDDMQEIMSAGIKPAEIDQIIVRGDRALAATKLTQVRHRHYPRPVCLVYTLEKQGGSCVIRDVDVEDKPGLTDEIRRFNVDTSPRGAAREGELPAADGRAKQLKANIDSFTLTLARYSGEQPPGPPQQSLVLHVPTNGFKHTRAVQIDKRQAEQIIDQLAAEGFLNSFHDMHAWKFIEAPRGAHYMLSVQAGDAHFAQHLSWNRTMLSRLQQLRKVLRGDAAEAMDQLLAPPAPAEQGSPE